MPPCALGPPAPHADLADVGPPGRVLWCLQGCEPPSEVGRDGFPLLLVFILSHDCAGDFGFCLKLEGKQLNVFKEGKIARSRTLRAEA